MRVHGATAESIQLAGKLLRSGELVAFPTETVYGLGAVISDEEAVRRIYAVKGRPADNPLIAHIASPEQINQLVSERPAWLDAVLATFWPGPLSVVLPHGGKAPDWATAGLDTVAVRCPSHEVATELLRHVGQPVVAPSANLSGKPSPTTADHVIEDFAHEERVAMLLDGGACEIGLESTVLLVRPEQGVILRAGHIGQLELKEVAGVPIAYHTEEADQPRSPGQKYRHYAPSAKVRLVSRDELTGSEDFVLALQPTRTERLLSPQRLYRELRTADRQDIKEVYIVADGVSGHVPLWERIQKIIAE